MRAVGADYGLTAMDGSSPAAYRLAMLILSPEGRPILARRGFAAEAIVAEPAKAPRNASDCTVRSG